MSLYANENVDVSKLYDPETGEYLDNGASDAQQDEIRTFIADGKTMERFKKHGGWKLLTEYLTTCVSKYKDALVSETDFNKIVRLQEAVKAYENAMAYVDWKINEAKGFEQQTDPSLSEG